MPAASDPWKQLFSAATLGVSRAPLAPEALWPAGVSPMPAPNGASTLLRAALTGHLWRTAGARAPAGAVEPLPASAPAPAPAVARAHVSEAAAWRLARMLNGSHRELIPQWLALAEAAGRELPAHWLPPVLAGLEAPLRRRFQGVLGPRAAWLGELNPRWGITPAPPSEPLWESGTLEERLIQLRRLREQDPDRGRAWLSQSWPSETPEGRQKLLPALRIGLSPADEGFLEQALDDRRKEVRWVAAECLIRLPESAHARRGWERIRALITPQAGTRKLQLRIELPTALDASAQRDGIEVKRPAGVRVGERSWWLCQMLGRTPPQRWSEDFHCAPAAFLDALDRADRGPELLPALAAAALLHPQAPWGVALFERLRHGDQERAVSHLEDMRQLLCSLPPQEQQTVLLDFLTTAPPGLLRPFLAYELPWNATTSAEGVKRACMLLHYGHRVELAPLAHHVHLASAQQALAAVLERLPQESRARSQLDPLNEILDFRAAMTQELMADG